MYGVWQGLTANLAVVAAVVFLWSHLRDTIRSIAPSIETAAFGSVMGCGGLLAIAFGHQIGDRLLVEVGRRLEAVCRNDDLVARLGGDEFAVIGEGTDLKTSLAKLAQRLTDRLTAPFAIDEATLLPSASIGFAIYPHDAQTSDVLTALADQALYAAKRSGRRTWRAYSADFIEAEPPTSIEASSG